jgi:hypothetical protein
MTPVKCYRRISCLKIVATGAVNRVCNRSWNIPHPSAMSIRSRNPVFRVRPLSPSSMFVINSLGLSRSTSGACSWIHSQPELSYIHRPTASDWRFLRAGRNSRLRMNVPSTSPPNGASRASLVYAGKKKVRYFLNTPRTQVWFSTVTEPSLYEIQD